MATETVVFFATAPDGEPLPTVAGVAFDAPIEVLGVIRTADQIRLTFRRALPDIRFPRHLALALRAPRPLLA